MAWESDTTVGNKLQISIFGNLQKVSGSRANQLPNPDTHHCGRRCDRNTKPAGGLGGGGGVGNTFNIRTAAQGETVLLLWTPSLNIRRKSKGYNNKINKT